MKKAKILILLLLNCIFLQAQNGISGYLNLEVIGNWKSEISLYEVDMNGNQQKVESDFLAKVSIDKTGYFEFSADLFGNENKFYKVEFDPQDENNFIKFPSFHIFILSKTDSLYFQKSNLPFGSYTNTNLADLEWQKFNQFESKLNLNDATIFRKKYKPYVKDSLQILMVKLIGIQQLKDKQLLEKDIQENPNYYLNLLEDFQSSDLNPTDYAHLESEIAMVELTEVNEKYQMSLWWNGISVCLILGLFFSVFQMRKKVKNQLPILSPNLSGREELIKSLILEGKSNKEIASELFISLSTVKTHITSLYKKLGVSGRKEILIEK
ncbi:MAG: LuxR C-terminal-related transcriptional regulator [Saprospiraceae bacterium]